VSGIGFLGGGTILREGVNVRGLNTAATLWCSAAVGSLAGMGYLLPAIITTAVVLATNVFLRPAAMLINRAPVEQATEVDITYRLEVTCREEVEQHIRALLLQETASDALLLKSLQSQDVEGAKQVRILADVVTAGRNDRLIERILSRLSLEPGLAATNWQIVGQDA
jgi:putative Mg2+ transporter-C (MgtC) family protein